MVEMGLNIKNERTVALAREVAQATGESLTAAITVALEERLERLRHQGGGSRADVLRAIAHDIAKHIKEPYKSIDHGELLYDERGLPK